MNTKKSITLITAGILTLSLVVAAQVSAAVADSVSFLRSKQDVSGLVEGSVRSTDWAVIGVSAVGTNPATVGSPSLATAMNANSPGSAATDLERRILALRAAGLDASAETNQLSNHVSNRQLGSSELLNDDTFGVLALRAAGGGPSVVADSVAFIQAHQNADGGFSSLTGGSSDVDSTGAALAALAAAGGSVDVINRGFDYLAAQQNGDGGFGVKAGSGSNVDSTSWALWAYHTAGRANASALAWLRSAQRADGSFGGAVTTAYAMIALSGRSLPILGSFPSLPPQGSPSATPGESAPTVLPPPPALTSPVASSSSLATTSSSVSVAGVSASAAASSSSSGGSAGSASTSATSVGAVQPTVSSGRVQTEPERRESPATVLSPRPIAPTLLVPPTPPAQSQRGDSGIGAVLNSTSASQPSALVAGVIDTVAARSTALAEPPTSGPDRRLVQRLVIALVVVGGLDLVVILIGLVRLAVMPSAQPPRF